MRLRFTTRRLLLFVTCWCIALGLWRTCIYEPPTHKIPLYEKAYGTRRLSKSIGPNTIRIAQVVRSTDGRGRYVLQNPAGVAAREEEFTLAYQMRGIGRVPWQFRFQDASTGKLLTEFETSPHTSSRSSGHGSLVGHTNFRKPLKEIDAVEITLQPAP